MSVGIKPAMYKKKTVFHERRLSCLKISVSFKNVKTYI